MEIIKKIPVSWKSLVDNPDEPNFIYFGDKSFVYDYKMKRYNVYTNADYKFGSEKGYFEIKESNFTYVIRMKFCILSSNYKGFFLVQEKDNRNYLQKRYDGTESCDRDAVPKMSSGDFFEFFEVVQNGIIKPVNGYFECNLRLVKKTSQYFLKFFKEDNSELFVER